jgi:microcystin-dependent protein
MDSFLASIILFGGSFAPRSWTYCQGQVLSVNQNAALFSLLSNTYGGDGRSTFGIPDLRGRVPLGTGPGNGLTEFPLGRQVGNNSVVLATENLAPHHHLATFTGTGGGGSADTTDVQVTVNVPVSSQLGESAAPTANCYLAETVAGGGGQDKPEKIYRSSTAGIGANPVNLGGVTATATVTGGSSGGITGGTVTVENTGGNIPVSLIQPSLAMNYILCVDGSYPSRT